VDISDLAPGWEPVDSWTAPVERSISCVARLCRGLPPPVTALPPLRAYSRLARAAGCAWHHRDLRAAACILMSRATHRLPGLCCQRNVRDPHWRGQRMVSRACAAGSWVVVAARYLPLCRHPPRALATIMLCACLPHGLCLCHVVSFVHHVLSSSPYYILGLPVVGLYDVLPALFLCLPFSMPIFTFPACGCALLLYVFSLYMHCSFLHYFFILLGSFVVPLLRWLLHGRALRLH